MEPTTITVNLAIIGSMLGAIVALVTISKAVNGWARKAAKEEIMSLTSESHAALVEIVKTVVAEHQIICPALTSIHDVINVERQERKEADSGLHRMIESLGGSMQQMFTEIRADVRSIRDILSRRAE